MSESRLDRARAVLAAAEEAASSAAGGRHPSSAPRGSGGAPPVPDLVDLDDADATAQARQIVLRQLAAAPRSRAQLEDKLAAKDVDPEVAAAVLDRFAEVGLVDDEAYAEMLVRSQQESRGLARRGLANELRKKGIDPDTAADALSTVDPESERARAEDLVQARLRRLHGLPKDVQMRRLGGMLARKGYPADLSYGVIRDALRAAEEHLRD
ncbi:regulatory protein RecX [Mobilicoccus caccae]|uniref:Regulatory protein RecX n=1 Tax=Mobilicoccus caccae TaxID=1859295 RepID=A0ABQ6IMT8_9MICO|nr:regulatory protein RecX [Mobilicoccus caccae]GMA39233.1 regulatory protein RecX [Mobilicoccus caccae]